MKSLLYAPKESQQTFAGRSFVHDHLKVNEEVLGKKKIGTLVKFTFRLADLLLPISSLVS